jgi:hypothetical protein
LKIPLKNKGKTVFTALDLLLALLSFVGINQPPKTSYFMRAKPALLAFLFFAFLFSNCKKKDTENLFSNKETVERFFTVPVTANSQLRAFIEQLKEENNRTNFVPSMVKKNGFPLWEKTFSSAPRESSRTAGEPELQFYIVPFTDEKQSVTAYFKYIENEEWHRSRIVNKADYLRLASIEDDTSKLKKDLQDLSLFCYFERVSIMQIHFTCRA